MGKFTEVRARQQGHTPHTMRHRWQSGWGGGHSHLGGPHHGHMRGLAQPEDLLLDLRCTNGANSVHQRSTSTSTESWRDARLPSEANLLNMMERRGWDARFPHVQTCRQKLYYGEAEGSRPGPMACSFFEHDSVASMLALSLPVVPSGLATHLGAPSRSPLQGRRVRS